MATWQFRPINPNENSGTSTVDDNFANEERTSVEILVRETLQNPLDARNADDVVEVKYNIVNVDRTDSEFLSTIFSEKALLHFESGKLIKDTSLPKIIPFLVIEDFGTSGLEGTFSDSSIDGRAENWNAFWFREGEGAKPTKSNGGAGQGKITLYAASEIRSLIALTRRYSDDKELLFGCCRFKQNYKILGESSRWAKEARWGAIENPDIQATPLEDKPLIAKLKLELNLSRGDRSGTSFLVPMPFGITLDNICKAVIDEFFFPIRRGRLKVTVGEKILDASTVSGAAKSLGPSARHTPAYRDFLEKLIETQLKITPTATALAGWNLTSKLANSSFTHENLESLRKSFENSELLSVDFPLKIRKKGCDPTLGKFRVILRQEQDSDSSEELFIRQDLSIDGEKRLKGSRRTQPVFALTFIDDMELSAFLTSAEEPTHRTWNASRPKVKALYDGTNQLLNAVRNAALRLVEFLTPAGRRDNTALALYFADPNSVQDKPKRGPDGKKTPLSPILPGEINIDIPAPKPKSIKFMSLVDGFSIATVPDEMQKKSLPLSVEIKTAYATTLGDPFKQWDAADFWLNDDKNFLIDSNSVENISRDGNVIRFEICSPDASFSLRGFDENRKVEVQINYREHEDAQDIEND